MASNISTNLVLVGTLLPLLLLLLLLFPLSLPSQFPSILIKAMPNEHKEQTIKIIRSSFEQEVLTMSVKPLLDTFGTLLDNLKRASVELDNDLRFHCAYEKKERKLEELVASCSRQNPSQEIVLWMIPLNEKLGFVNVHYESGKIKQIFVSQKDDLAKLKHQINLFIPLPTYQQELYIARNKLFLSNDVSSLSTFDLNWAEHIWLMKAGNRTVSINNLELTFDLKISTTIKQLKQLIEKERNIPYKDQRLLTQAGELAADDSQPVGDLDYFKGSSKLELFMAHSLSKGGNINLAIEDRDVLSIYVQPSDTLGSLKNIILRSLGRGSLVGDGGGGGKVELFFKSARLEQEDSVLLKDIEIYDGVWLMVKVSSSNDK